MAKQAGSVSWRRILIESAVIVFSILLAFGIDASWGARQDRVREQAYLGLLASDLRSTLENNRQFGELADSRLEPATVQLVQAYYQPALPAIDSLAAWLDAAVVALVVQPRLGTAEALVASGDLALIQSDSLQIAIRDYLTDVTFFDQAQRRSSDSHRSAVEELSRHVNLAQVRLSLPAPLAFDSITASAPLSPFPAGAIRTLPQVDLEEVVRDPTLHALLYRMLQQKNSLKTWRDLMRQRSEQLLARIELAFGE